MPPPDLNRRSSSRWSSFRFTAGGILTLLAAAQFGCGRPFNVKTQPALPPASYAAKALIDSVAVEAQAITDEDLLYDIFDANLISAGLLPVRVRLTNSGGEAIDLKSARFEIEGPAGRLKALDAKKSFKRLISYYGVSAYTKAGYSESLESFVAFALDVATPLAGGQSRQGLVFFRAPSETARQAGLTMIVARLNSKQSAGTVSLKLN